MKLIAAIRGRFARLLLRLARRLDSGLVTAPMSVMSDQMALLRQRYAGAPEHWLEAVARRAPVAQIPEAAHPARPPAPAFDQDRRQPATAEVRFDAGAPTPAERPKVRFAAGTRRGRPALCFTRRDSGRTARQPLHLTPDRKRRRPPLMFRTADACAWRPEPAAVPPPPARRPQPVFAATADNRPQQPEPDSAPHDAAAAPRRPIDLPPLPTRPLETPARQLPEPLAGERPQPRFPDPPPRALPPQCTWHAAPDAGHTEAAFSGSDPVWPELPALAEEEGLAEPGRDEARLAREQMVGRWNG